MNEPPSSTASIYTLTESIQTHVKTILLLDCDPELYHWLTSNLLPSLAWLAADHLSSCIAITDEVCSAVVYHLSQLLLLIKEILEHLKNPAVRNAGHGTPEQHKSFEFIHRKTRQMNILVYVITGNILALMSQSLEALKAKTLETPPEPENLHDTQEVLTEDVYLDVSTSLVWLDDKDYQLCITLTSKCDVNIDSCVATLQNINGTGGELSLKVNHYTVLEPTEWVHKVYFNTLYPRQTRKILVHGKNVQCATFTVTIQDSVQRWKENPKLQPRLCTAIANKLLINEEDLHVFQVLKSTDDESECVVVLLRIFSPQARSLLKTLRKHQRCMDFQLLNVVDIREGMPPECVHLYGVPELSVVVSSSVVSENALLFAPGATGFDEEVVPTRKIRYSAVNKVENHWTADVFLCEGSSPMDALVLQEEYFRQDVIELLTNRLPSIAVAELDCKMIIDEIYAYLECKYQNITNSNFVKELLFHLSLYGESRDELLEIGKSVERLQKSGGKQQVFSTANRPPSYQQVVNLFMNVYILKHHLVLTMQEHQQQLQEEVVCIHDHESEVREEIEMEQDTKREQLGTTEPEAETETMEPQDSVPILPINAENGHPSSELDGKYDNFIPNPLSRSPQEFSPESGSSDSAEPEATSPIRITTSASEILQSPNTSELHSPDSKQSAPNCPAEDSYSSQNGIGYHPSSEAPEADPATDPLPAPSKPSNAYEIPPYKGGGGSTIPSIDTSSANDPLSSKPVDAYHIPPYKGGGGSSFSSVENSSHSSLPVSSMGLAPNSSRNSSHSSLPVSSLKLVPVNPLLNVNDLTTDVDKDGEKSYATDLSNGTASELTNSISHDTQEGQPHIEDTTIQNGKLRMDVEQLDNPATHSDTSMHPTTTSTHSPLQPVAVKQELDTTQEKEIVTPSKEPIVPYLSSLPTRESISSYTASPRESPRENGLAPTQSSPDSMDMIDSEGKLKKKKTKSVTPARVISTRVYQVPGTSSIRTLTPRPAPTATTIPTSKGINPSTSLLKKKSATTSTRTTLPTSLTPRVATPRTPSSVKTTSRLSGASSASNTATVSKLKTTYKPVSKTPSKTITRLSGGSKPGDSPRTHTTTTARTEGGLRPYRSSPPPPSLPQNEVGVRTSSGSKVMARRISEPVSPMASSDGSSMQNYNSTGGVYRNSLGATAKSGSTTPRTANTSANSTIRRKVISTTKSRVELSDTAPKSNIRPSPHVFRSVVSTPSTTKKPAGPGTIRPTTVTAAAIRSNSHPALVSSRPARSVISRESESAAARKAQMKLRAELTQQRVATRQVESIRQADIKKQQLVQVRKVQTQPKLASSRRKSTDQDLEQQKNRCNQLHALLKEGTFSWMPAQPPPPPPMALHGVPTQEAVN